MKRCPTCEATYESRRLLCPTDREILIDEGVPVAETGQVLLGRYRLGNLLGEGGMGRVLEARRLDTGEVVALKFLKTLASASDEERTLAEKRFRREAEAAAALDHPGIVRALEFAETPEGQCFMVLERLYGATFDELRRAGKLSSPERVVALASQVCEVLAVAHGRGIIHRDLKPSNLFLHRVDGDRWQVKVLDFGIAKFLEGGGERLTSTGEFLGTLLYMAPEQASGQPLTAAMDIYTLGVILFEALAGRVPFKARTPIDLLRLHASVPAPSLLTFRPDISTELDEVVARCLRKKPAQRYANAGELGAALSAIRSSSADPETRDPTTTLRVNASHWVGQVLEDRYEIQEWVSRGRFGSDVYRATHLRTQASVAVRLWRLGSPSARECLVAALRREGRAMEVRHPNLIAILDMGFSDEYAYVVTEFVRSVSLRELIVRRGPLSYAAVYGLIRGAAAALGALHQVGIVSGGLSPETIRAVSGEAGLERLLISPLGLTSLIQMDPLLREPPCDATEDPLLEYLSPEQRDGAEPDPRSDLYSLACIALEMLGEGPDKQPTVSVKAAPPQRTPLATRAREPESPRWAPSEKLGAERRLFFLRATNLDPAARFACAADFLEALPRP